MNKINGITSNGVWVAVVEVARENDNFVVSLFDLGAGVEDTVLVSKQQIIEAIENNQEKAAQIEAILKLSENAPIVQAGINIRERP